MDGRGQRAQPEHLGYGSGRPAHLHHEARDQDWSNAVLIATAPDTLDALYRIANMQDRDGNLIEMHRDELRGIARAALQVIIKARA